MAEIVLFNIPAPGVGETVANKVYWFQSLNGQMWDAIAIDNILVSALPVDALTGKYRWSSALADPLKYHMLKTESASGVLGAGGMVVPPRATDPDICIIIADLKMINLQPQAGIEFNCLLKPAPQIINGIIMDPGPQSVKTDATGRVQFNVAKGGKYEVACAVLKTPIAIDTTGKSFINLSTLI